MFLEQLKATPDVLPILGSLYPGRNCDEVQVHEGHLPTASQKPLQWTRISQNWIERQCTTLQSIMNAKLSLHRFWHCHENGFIKTIQMIPHNLYVSVKLNFLGLRLILVYPNPQ